MDEGKRIVSADKSPILLALAERYRKSKAGQEPTIREYLDDYRKLLAHAKSTDGESRLRAEEDLRRAVHQSNGRLSLDLHPRDPKIIHSVRLRSGGEEWLFHHLGQSSPTTQRNQLSAFFQDATETVGLHPEFQTWLESLVESAQLGLSIQPFERNDLHFNQELLHVIQSVLTWKEESLIRYASAVICGDSKRLESLRARIQRALCAITGDESVTLETFGIIKTPREVVIHGPLTLQLENGELNLGLLYGPVSISGTDLELATKIESEASCCLTVENESVFHELAKKRTGIFLIHTSFPGGATCYLLKRLTHEMKFYHFGDSDPTGFDILRDLRERTGKNFQPVEMALRPSEEPIALTRSELKTLERLLSSPTLSDVAPILKSILKYGSKGDFEQESLGQSGLQDVIETILGKIETNH